MTVLKAYKYKRAKIYIRELTSSLFEYLLVYKNNLYTQSFVLDSKAKNVKERGGVAIILCEIAEATADKLREKNLFYKIFGRFLPSVKFAKTEERTKKE